MRMIAITVHPHCTGVRLKGSLGASSSFSSGLSPMIEGGAQLLEPAQAANAVLKLLVKTLNALVIHTELICFYFAGRLAPKCEDAAPVGRGWLRPRLVVACPLAAHSTC